VFQLVSCQEVLSVERASTSLDITGVSTRLVILLVSPEVFGAGVSLSTVAVVYRLALRSFANPSGPRSVDFSRRG
jgi:hypothetical protein